MPIQVDVIGKILNGDRPDRQVLITNEEQGWHICTWTGDFNARPLITHDVWVKAQEHVELFFHKSGWEVEWPDGSKFLPRPYRASVWANQKFLPIFLCITLLSVILIWLIFFR